MENAEKTVCCKCEGIAIALGLFALGLFIVIATTLVLSALFYPSIISIIALLISSITAFFVLCLIYRIVKVCIALHHSSGVIR